MYGISKEQQAKTLQRKCSDLRDRLRNGWGICEKDPDNKKLEDHWLGLLKDYERCVIDLRMMGLTESGEPVVAAQIRR